jgi:hypothetical protein
MQKIPIDKVAPGMVLAYDVETSGGKILASADSTVDSGLLRRLQMAGVAKIMVQGKPVPGADVGYDALARLNRLERLFRRHNDDRFMTTLKNMLRKHLNSLT